MMKTFKDVNLSHIPAPVADLLRMLIPEDADVEIVYADAVKDDCTPMGCADCSECPIDKATAVNLMEPVTIISNAYMKLASLVRVTGNVPQEERNYAIDALSDISNAVDYALDVLERGN